MEQEQNGSVNGNVNRPWGYSSGSTSSAAIAAAAAAAAYYEEDELDFYLAQFVLGEDTVKEVMKLLEEEITQKNSNSSSYPNRPITESCGPKPFSDSSSSMMASDYVSENGLYYLLAHTQAFSFTYTPSLMVEDEGSVSGSGDDFENKAGGDSKECDDEWWERVLSGTDETTFDLDDDDDQEMGMGCY